MLLVICLLFAYASPVCFAGTNAKQITNSSLLILLSGMIRLPELKPIGKQKADNIFVTPAILDTMLSGRLSFLIFQNISRLAVQYLTDGFQCAKTYGFGFSRF